MGGAVRRGGVTELGANKLPRLGQLHHFVCVEQTKAKPVVDVVTGLGGERKEKRETERQQRKG